MSISSKKILHAPLSRVHNKQDARHENKCSPTTTILKHAPARKFYEAIVVSTSASNTPLLSAIALEKFDQINCNALSKCQDRSRWYRLTQMQMTPNDIALEILQSARFINIARPSVSCVDHGKCQVNVVSSSIVLVCEECSRNWHRSAWTRDELMPSASPCSQAVCRDRICCQRIRHRHSCQAEPALCRSDGWL